ncbi:MAG: type II secretion system GspH family protein [Bdellovibrionaceae bacterium]|nr:type II secretion system GspH family protein [Pseudobdellovibrionaceae bacterium]
MLARKQTGFTIIEMLMVILLVAILSAVAIPQFLDFRTDARDAATNAALGAMRTGIANMKGMMILRCGAAATAWPTTAALTANDITTAGGNCTAVQVANAADRRIVADTLMPENPWGPNQARTVTECVGAAGCDPTDATDCLGAAYDPNVTDGWCYNPTSGQIWANSANSTGPADEHTF